MPVTVMVVRMLISVLRDVSDCHGDEDVDQ